MQLLLLCPQTSPPPPPSLVVTMVLPSSANNIESFFDRIKDSLTAIVDSDCTDLFKAEKEKLKSIISAYDTKVTHQNSQLLLLHGESDVKAGRPGARKCTIPSPNSVDGYRIKLILINALKAFNEYQEKNPQASVFTLSICTAAREAFKSKPQPGKLMGWMNLFSLV